MGKDPPWDAWDPPEITERLAGVDIPWCVAAGWALDLFRGETTREHEDLEIAVPIAMFDRVRAALADFDVEVVGSGHRWPLESEAFDVMVQTWVREPDTGIYRLDIFREPHDGDTWICRRDERIRLPYEQIFAGVLPLLDQTQRAWLADALIRVHPGHRWLGALAATG